jgi:phosphatidylinositol-3-phosphatase
MIIVLILIVILGYFKLNHSLPLPKVNISSNHSPIKSSLHLNLPKLDHIVVVVEENHAFNKIIGSSDAPYMNSLVKNGLSFSESHGVTHPSQPNYLALFSGSTQGVTTDNCPVSFTAPNLAAELKNKGLTFTGYSEDLPSVGSKVCQSNGYYRKHSPWVDFSNISSNLNQPFTAFPEDFSKLPTVAFVIPNVNHDMHDGTIKEADNWLKTNIAPYVQWAKTHNSLLIVSWDEDDNTKANKIPTIFVGSMVKPGVSNQQITHFNVLRTIEEMYRLPLLGASQSVNPIEKVWK